MEQLSNCFGWRFLPMADIRNPGAEAPVWADPFSLAATGGVSVDFFSYGY
jgi:hypothetical protein